jgi:hypothetical protein
MREILRDEARGEAASTQVLHLDGKEVAAEVKLCDWRRAAAPPELRVSGLSGWQDGLVACGFVGWAELVWSGAGVVGGEHGRIAVAFSCLR